MSLVKLGRMKLRWCDKCNLPLVGKNCSLCGSEGRWLNITPPGDARPAFEFDREMIKKLVDEQFGKGCGDLFLPDDRVALLNRAPSEDRMDEIIVDGQVIGTLRYDLFLSKFSVSLRVEGAARIFPKLERSWIVVDEGAVKPILKSANVLSVGITGIADGIEKGDEVVALSPKREVIAVGRAMMSSEEMKKAHRGVGIKVRSRLKNPVKESYGSQTWEDVVEANKDAIERNISRSTEFLKKSSEKYELPLVVSYSGGKDSLASLLLTLDAGLRPKMMFLNTGIELPETVENAERTAEKYELELEIVDAGDAFWRGLEVFGPPAKDYRWCCKACKLGPTTQFINRKYPKGILSVIGQRSYESEARFRKGNEWENPWVKGQIGISPIQNWTALEVWLYLFYKGAEWNPWYERGMYRIGCYLCPSADMGDTEVLKRGFAGYERWEQYLKGYAEKKGMDEDWVTHGLWRWGRLPAWMKSTGLEIPEIHRGKGGVSFSGDDILRTSADLDMRRVENFASILGKWEKIDGKIVIDRICTISKNEIGVTSPSSVSSIKSIIERAVNCIGCGVCVGRCPVGAISIENHVATVSSERCVHCMKCLDGPCPAIDFNPATS